MCCVHTSRRYDKCGGRFLSRNVTCVSPVFAVGTPGPTAVTGESDSVPRHSTGLVRLILSNRLWGADPCTQTLLVGNYFLVVILISNKNN